MDERTSEFLALRELIVSVKRASQSLAKTEADTTRKRLLNDITQFMRGSVQSLSHYILIDLTQGRTDNEPPRT